LVNNLEDKLKSIIDHSIDITSRCLSMHSNWVDISKAIGDDMLSHRSDKERYLLTVLFAYGFTDAFLRDLPGDEFSPALEKIVNDLHDVINKDQKLKKRLFNSVPMDAITTLETCVWLSKQQMDKTMHTIMITTSQINYLVVNKIVSIPDTDEHRQIIKNGSKFTIGEPILNGLHNIFKDNEIRISNFSEGIKRP